MDRVNFCFKKNNLQSDVKNIDMILIYRLCGKLTIGQKCSMKSAIASGVKFSIKGQVGRGDSYLEHSNLMYKPFGEPILYTEFRSFQKNFIQVCILKENLYVKAHLLYEFQTEF